MRRSVRANKTSGVCQLSTVEKKSKRVTHHSLESILCAGSLCCSICTGLSSSSSITSLTTIITTIIIITIIVVVVVVAVATRAPLRLQKRLRLHPTPRCSDRLKHPPKVLRHALHAHTCMSEWGE